ncbi:MAG: PaaI family thioesterase [Burkholderiaceae bacterium]|nr:PaaI family thioesterase [Burkholderiaceae bacterium]
MNDAISSDRTNAAASAEETLERWRAEEAQVRAKVRAIGVSRPEQVAGLTGMQMFEAMFEGRLPWAPIGDTLDFVPVHIEPGYAVFQGAPKFAHYNPLGTVHGGWFATLLDSAVACAVHSTLPVGKAYTTIELKTNIVRALTEQVPLVRAEGRVVHGGNQVATAEGRLFGPDGRLYAHASTTCLVFDARPPKAR